MKKRWWLLLLLLPLTLIWPFYSSDAKTVKIVITSDQHSWISSTYLYPRRKPTGLLHLKDQIQAIRRLEGEILLLDGGDLLQGSPLANYIKTTRDPAQNNPFFDLFESLQYDAVVVGNHDLEENPIFEDSYLPKSRTPWLAANAYRRGKNVFQPYLITDKKGFKIVVLGLTTPGVHLWVSQYSLQGLKVKSLVKETKKWVEIIREKESPDLLVVVFHAGLDALRDDEATKSQGLPSANEVYQAIVENQDIDFAITGHSHRLVPYKTGRPISYIGRVPVVSAGHHGKAMLVAAIEQTSDRPKVVSVVIEKPSTETVEYQPKTAYKNWVEEQLPWKLVTKDKVKLGQCLDEALSMGVRSWASLQYTVFPKIKIRSLRGSYQKKIPRKNFLEWIPYNNKWLMTVVSERDLELLQKPLPLAGKNRVAYNQILAIYPPIKFVKPKALISSRRFQKESYIAISAYHYLGGGGFAGKLFWEEGTNEKYSDMNLREALWFHLSSAGALPAACDGILQRQG